MDSKQDQAASRTKQRRCAFLTSLLAATVFLSCPFFAAAQEINLNPTRPTVANAATIQTKGVLQVETGYDAYPQKVPGNQQTLDTAFFYTPLDRLRLDFTWSAFDHQQDSGNAVNGVGTIEVGGKILLRKERPHRPPPPSAFNTRRNFQLPPSTHCRAMGSRPPFW